MHARELDLRRLHSQFNSIKQLSSRARSNSVTPSFFCKYMLLSCTRRGRDRERRRSYAFSLTAKTAHLACALRLLSLSPRKTQAVCLESKAQDVSIVGLCALCARAALLSALIIRVINAPAQSRATRSQRLRRFSQTRANFGLLLSKQPGARNASRPLICNLYRAAVTAALLPRTVYVRVYVYMQRHCGLLASNLRKFTEHAL